MSKAADKVVKEDGKTFYVMGTHYIRQHDDNWQGKKTNYRRCRRCKRLVAKQHHVAHQAKYHNGIITF
jgi:hypothetical protein